ncbi:MAG: FkbM family methyltransferase [Pseudomonadota bacterium]
MAWPRHDLYVGRSLDLYGEYGEAEVALFRQLVRPGAVVVEAGANIGTLTLPLARMVGPAGHVVALEPQRLIHQVLCANLALNAVENVTALRAAAGASAGVLRVPAISYRSKVNFGGVAAGTEEGEACPVTTIDALGLSACAFIKIDVEGAEAEVVAGAAGTLHAHRPVLYVENDRREKSAALIAALEALGYRLWWHLPPLFNPANYRMNADNAFGAIVSVNMLCLHRDDPRQVGAGLRPVAGPEDWWRSG